MRLLSKLLSLGLILTVFSACQSQIDEPSMVIDSNDHTTTKPILTKAIDLTIEILEDLDGSTTRGESRKISTINVIHTSSSTRSLNENPISFYLVNFEDNKGYALLGDKEDNLPLYAFSNEGNLNMDDPRHQEFLNNYLAATNIQSDSIGTINPGWGSTVIEQKRVIKAPFVPRSAQLWHQGSPFNMYCDNVGTGATFRLPPVGCAAVALGITMSCSQKTTSINGYPLNWTKMLDGTANNEVARLFKELGSKQYLDMTYRATLSQCPKNNISITLSKLWYKFNISSVYSESDLTNSIKNNKPVLVSGDRINDLGNLVSHSWVIDGLYNVTYTIQPGSMNPTKRTVPYYHCVWGWEGYANGYYAFENGIGGKPHSQESYEEGEGYKYDRNFSFIYNIYHE